MRSGEEQIEPVNCVTEKYKETTVCYNFKNVLIGGMISLVCSKFIYSLKPPNTV